MDKMNGIHTHTHTHTHTVEYYSAIKKRNLDIGSNVNGTKVYYTK